MKKIVLFVTLLILLRFDVVVKISMQERSIYVVSNTIESAIKTIDKDLFIVRDIYIIPDRIIIDKCSE
jgi:hypothetical protein